GHDQRFRRNAPRSQGVIACHFGRFRAPATARVSREPRVWTPFDKAQERIVMNKRALVMAGAVALLGFGFYGCLGSETVNPPPSTGSGGKGGSSNPTTGSGGSSNPTTGSGGSSNPTTGSGGSSNPTTGGGGGGGSAT